MERYWGVPSGRARRLDGRSDRQTTHGSLNDQPRAIEAGAPVRRAALPKSRAAAGPDQRGREACPAAEKLESIVLKKVLSLAGERKRIVGPVRIGTTEEFGGHYLAPRLSELTAAYPDLEIELVALPRNFSLATREVDVVVTLDRPATGDIRYRRLTELEFGVYGSAAYFNGRSRPTRIEELSLETWCGYISALLFTTQIDLPSLESDNICFKYRTTMPLRGVSMSSGAGYMPTENCDSPVSPRCRA